MDIVEELRQNRENGAKRLVSEYKAGLMSLARRFYKNESDAEELVNATFAKVVENIDDYLEQSAFFAWMCQILTNEFRRSVRRKSNKMELYPGVMPEVEDECAQENIYANLDASLLRDAIENLPKDVRKTLMMHYFMDLSVKDVARLLAIPVGTVKWRLLYARQILAAKLGVAAKKPGVKALLVALALAAITAAGAANAGARAARPQVPNADEPSALRQDAAQDRTRGTEGTRGASAPNAASIPSIASVLPVLSFFETLSPFPTTQTPPQEQTMNTATCSAALGAATALAVATPSFGGVIYQNDFSTRISKRPVPTGDWQELAYHAGPLARDYGGTWTDMGTPYADGSQIQDGWALANLAGTPSQNYVMAPAYVASDGGNLFFMQQGEGAARTSLATHPIGNDFTNGTLRISVDMRAPASWPVDGAGARVVPLFKSQMNALNWNALYETPSAFGMIWRANKSATFPFLLSAKENGSAQGNDLEDASMGQEWHRFVAEIDLDAKRTACSVYRLGLDHPTPATTGTLAASKSGLYFYSPLTAERGAVSGIGIYTSMTSASADDAANSACFDNLLVEWKAPGTSDFLPCYVNDFATRRVRTICPAGTTSGTYAMTPALANDEFTGYEARQLVPDSDQSLKNVKPQPTGVDNWRRINDDGQGKVDIVDSPARCLRMMKDLNAFVCVSQPLGEEIAGGKVRLSANVRLPDKWRNLSTRCSLIVLGAKSYASTLHQNLSQGHVGQVGIGGTADTDFRPRYAEGGAQYGSATCTASSWYQLVQTADIDNQTYDYTLYAIVNGTIQTNPVFSVTGKPFANTVDSIGSFALMGYALGDNTTKAVLFNNLKVWKNVGTAQETLIYSNDFWTRRRRVDVARADVAPVIDRADSGVDNWVRRNNGTAAAFIQSAANPALAFSGATGHAYVFHPFGKTVTTGTLCFRVDMRPAARWKWNSACGGVVLLGDDTFLQGNRDSSDSFSAHYSVRFGVVGAAGSADACGLSQGSKPYARSGVTDQTDAALDTTHWYRFCVSAPLDGGTYSVALYDMGAEHPDPETPNGAFVRRFSNLAYCNGGPTAGISGFALAGFFVPGYSAWDPEDPDALLFDNVVVEAPAPFVMIVR